MEIVKQNETYKFTDTFETWTVEGTASKDVIGTFNIYFNVNNLDEVIGYCNYTNDNGKSSLNCNTNESFREKFMTCLTSVITSVTQHFAE